MPHYHIMSCPLLRSEPIPQKVTFIEKHFGPIHQIFALIGRLAANRTFVQSEQKIPHRSPI